VLVSLLEAIKPAGDKLLTQSINQFHITISFHHTHSCLSGLFFCCYARLGQETRLTLVHTGSPTPKIFVSFDQTLSDHQSRYKNVTDFLRFYIPLHKIDHFGDALPQPISWLVLRKQKQKPEEMTTKYTINLG